ncbi:probable LRR receptor-like serine/threonine-protein kinase At1g74360 [Cynara cardunculus var. scolymus]|uniref:probable LRR receptor-like serine/threonine-protein kinase At1g74360 n=1 Tax=Cynara cardunculus var. scolymus TaxID=59895 RepID=UPI000D62C785|nr:probable LRR receptor-like serine/threonine-protein kinase At1g74360 [Cynara cardunculus var. scolymus]
MSADRIAFIIFFILFTGKDAIGDSLESDKQVLLNLKSFLEQKNTVNQGNYKKWDRQAPTPCMWPGISCSGDRVTEIRLPENSIAGNLFGNFSALTQLAYLDLSANTIDGTIPADLGGCRNLKVLNLSHNIIDGQFNFTGLDNLQILDLSVNRLSGDIMMSFPRICNSLVVANLSTNNFTGEISSMDGCSKLEYVDLSSNFFTGNLWFGFHRFKEFSVSENNLNDSLPAWIFPENCTLEALDLSENTFSGGIPKEISNCKNLTILDLSGNHFSDKIPTELGLLTKLEQLFLGNNSISREIPESLLGLRILKYLDLSRNNFGGDIQEIFGRFTQVKNLLLHANGYTGGLNSSGILRLQNVSRLDLSFNNLSGPLPPEISQMSSLKYLILAHNHFSGRIPSEFGNLRGLQALDLSINDLNGSIPQSLGRLSSLLWLMLANNSLSGQIPPQLGNCSSLLWLNLANNQLSGQISPELANIGRNAAPTFLFNRENNPMAGSGECSAMRRWIPANYPPFSFVYTLLNRKKCRSLWDTILKGHGIFQVCLPGSNIRTRQISGYIQLSGNRLSGQIPPEIGKMDNFTMVHLGDNEFSGTLPAEIGGMPLVVLNISRNNFSGRIPIQLGYLKCLRNLDLSYNNFSGTFPTNLNNLTDLSKFNVSYNPYISGVIPAIGQLATFEKASFLGDPLLSLPSFIDNSTNSSTANGGRRSQPPRKWSAVLVFMFLLLAFTVFGVMTILICFVIKSPVDQPPYLMNQIKSGKDFTLNSGCSSPWSSETVKVIRLDKTAFTHADILKATGNFANERIIGRGGFGTVYRGLLPDGREVAIKKKLREGIEGEREFRAEMEVLTRNGFGWPHPNLVTLYGWCLYGSEKLLVYEYMEGGTLEDVIPDRSGFNWKRRIDVAIDVAHALVFLHHECYPAIVHRDVKANNVLLDKNGKARVTDFGLARVVDVGDSHVSTMVAGTIGYVAPEYGQTWKATTKGDVYSYGVLVMELATGRRAVDGGEECLVEWSRKVDSMIPVSLLATAGAAEGAVEMCELLRIGIRCTAEAPQFRPNMKEVLDMLVRILANRKDFSYGSFIPSS